MLTKKALIHELEHINALRVNRLRVANLVLENPSSIKHLIDIVFNITDKTSIKAAWVLEFIIKKELSLIFPFIELYSKKIKTVYFGGAVRSVAKITVLLIERNDKKPCLTKQQEQRCVETAFDWLISNHKVATKAYAMQILFFLGKKTDWIHPELKIIIQENMHNESSAYKSRGRITIEQIAHYKIQ